MLPEDLRYTEEHEWVRVDENDENIITIGITDFAQKELGDIVFVDVDTLDDALEQGDVFGSIEAVKTVSDLFIPIQGTVISFNEDLVEQPDLINSSPYDKGWIIQVKMDDPSSLSSLLDAESYGNLIGE